MANIKSAAEVENNFQFIVCVCVFFESFDVDKRLFRMQLLKIVEVFVWYDIEN